MQGLAIYYVISRHYHMAGHSITVTAQTKIQFHEVLPTCWLLVIFNTRELAEAFLFALLLLPGNDFFVKQACRTLFKLFHVQF